MFQPEMLERYLGGYELAQSEAYRFCDDRCARISVRITLPRWPRPMASICGSPSGGSTGRARSMRCRSCCRWRGRLHRPGHLSYADQLRWSYAVDSACGVPRPGATGSVSLQLDPEAWYEVYVLAKAANPLLADGRLPG